jgi:hypothetical protein
MGRSEHSTASIGIKILLSDLILQINEANFNLIKEMLYDGSIEDENEYFNEVYEEIIGSDKLSENYLDFKEYLINELMSRGSYYKHKFTNKIIPTLDNGCLYDKYLLVPIKDILYIERFGYDRYGTNSISRPIDFELSVNIEKYKEIEKTVVVFLLNQYSG